MFEEYLSEAEIFKRNQNKIFYEIFAKKALEIFQCCFYIEDDGDSTK